MLKIRKIAFISLAVLAAVEIICFLMYIILSDNNRIFFGILASGLLTYIFFVGTLIFYHKAAGSESQNKLKYILGILFAKIIISAAAFYLVYRFDYINMWAYAISFLIFFTIFFNLEIFLIYKKFLFYKS